MTVGVRNNSQPATVVEMAYTRDLKSLGEILARSNRVGSTHLLLWWNCKTRLTQNQVPKGVTVGIRLGVPKQIRQNSFIIVMLLFIVTLINSYSSCII